MLEDALEYPFRTEEKFRNYGIALVLMISSIVIFPFFILMGYFVKIVAESLDGNDQLPEFEDFSGLFVDGLKLGSILLLYLFVGMIPLTAVSNLGFKAGIVGPFGGLFFVLVLYMMPSAVANFARKSRMLSAFDLREVVSQAFTRQYFIGVLTIIASQLIIGVTALVTMLVLAITIIGIPLLVVFYPLAYFYQYAVMHRLMARAVE
ncbi:MAG: DUF4013 domain-containing protein [Candidatus Nanohaloarchaea archaeon]